ncbi:hypothetical protein GCM10023159_03200 [Brevibacterium yomogidense]|nr:phosphotransferase [Brevibacterium yomogidense]
MACEHALQATILEAVSREYGLQPLDVRIFKGEYDRNIRITDPVRGTWLIKVSDARTPAVALDWQETVLAAAAGSGVAGGPAAAAVPGVATPHLLLTTSSDLRIEVVHGGETYRVRLVSWIAGDLLSARTDVPRGVYVALGGVSAQLTAAFAPLEPPEDLPEHAWLAQRGTREIRSALARLPTDGRTRAVAEVAAHFEHQHASRMARVPWGVVHHDLHDDNVVVAGNDSMALVGVIDFNDAHSAPLVADPAIAAAYATLRAEDPLDRIAAVVEGYEQHRALTDDEHALIRPLALLRLCTNWSVWSARAATAADPAYALHRSRHTWTAVDALLGEGRILGP